MESVGRLRSIVDGLERDAPASVRSFSDADAVLCALLEQKALALVHCEDMWQRPIIDAAGEARAPLTEDRFSGLERARNNILAQARTIAFVRALLRGLRDHEADLRAVAFK